MTTYAGGGYHVGQATSSSTLTLDLSASAAQAPGQNSYWPSGAGIGDPGNFGFPANDNIRLSVGDDLWVAVMWYAGTASASPPSFSMPAGWTREHQFTTVGGRRRHVEWWHYGPSPVDESTWTTGGITITAGSGPGGQWWGIAVSFQGDVLDAEFEAVGLWPFPAIVDNDWAPRTAPGAGPASPPLPVGLLAGDLMVLRVNQAHNPTTGGAPTVPAGWTLLGEELLANPALANTWARQGIYVKTAGASESPPSITRGTDATTISAQITAFRDVDSYTFTEESTTSTTTWQPSSVTTTGPATIIQFATSAGNLNFKGSADIDIDPDGGGDVTSWRTNPDEPNLPSRYGTPAATVGATSTWWRGVFAAGTYQCVQNELLAANPMVAHTLVLVGGSGPTDNSATPTAVGAGSGEVLMVGFRYPAPYTTGTNNLTFSAGTVQTAEPSNGWYADYSVGGMGAVGGVGYGVKQSSDRMQPRLWTGHYHSDRPVNWLWGPETLWALFTVERRRAARRPRVSVGILVAYA